MKRLFLFIFCLSGLSSLTLNPASAKVLQIAGAANFACALLESGKVKCWGLNSEGSLGAESETLFEPGSFSTVDFGTQEKVLELKSFAASLHMCALFESRRIKCWGFNGFGDLGLGDTQSRGDQKDEMGSKLPWVDLGSKDVRVSHLGSSAYGTCGVFENGKSKCWGIGIFGQNGSLTSNHIGTNAGQMGDRLAHLDFGTNKKVLQIEGGNGFNCVLIEVLTEAKEASGEIKCWGINTSGQLGMGNQNAYGGNSTQLLSKLPMIDLGSNLVTQLKVGEEHVCVLLKSGKVKCWGSNSYGQLGSDNALDRGYEANQMGKNIPDVDLGTDEKIVHLYASNYHNCVLFESGQAKCWGSNQSGELGLGDTKSRGNGLQQMGKDLPYLDFGKKVKIISMALGYHTTCAILAPLGEMKCYGNNEFGELGYPTTENQGVSPDQLGDQLPYVDFGEKTSRE